VIPGSVRRIVLIGFMGAGKSSVGRALADRLEWDFVDLDRAIVDRVELPVPEIFGSLGEPFFRKIEGEEGAVALERDQIVLATGGGWAAVPGRLEELPPGTVTVWLSVTSQEAIRRTATTPGTRPLLTGGDAVGFVVRLLEKRTPYYELADVEVDTDGLSVEDVSAHVLEALGRISTQETVE